MKIFKSFIFGLMAAATLGGFVSCQDDIDAPEPIAPVAENLDKVNTTIFDFKKEYWQDDQNYCKQVGTKPDGEHIYIKGRVISSDESGNVFKSIVIQDETAALAFSVNAYNLFLDHRVGQEMVVDLTGMYVGKYNNLMQMGWPDEYQDGLQTTFMSPEFFKAHVENNGMPDPSKVIVHQLDAISDIPNGTDGLIEWQSQLVRCNDVTFVPKANPNDASELVTTFGIYKTNMNQGLLLAGQELTLRVSGYADFVNEKMPTDPCDATFLLSYFGTGWQFMLMNTSDIENVGNPTLPKGTKENPWTVADAISEISEGATPQGWTAGYIVGTVAPSVTEVTSNTDIEWGADATLASTVVIAPTADCTEISQCIIVPLPVGSTMRNLVALRDHPENLGKLLTVYGTLDHVFGTYGITGNTGTGGEFMLEGVDVPDEPLPGVGDGSETNPYTCAQVIAMNPSSTTSSPDGGSQVWITGYIVGYVPTGGSSTNLADAVFTANGAPYSNIVLAPTADCKDATLCVAVQLSTTTDQNKAVRTALNLGDNPGNLGAQVSVFGDVMKYCMAAGLKNTTKYNIISGGVTPPTPPTTDAIFEESFTNGSLGSFTTTVEASSWTGWRANTQTPCAIANSYVNGTNEAATAWLISPEISLAGVTNPTLTLEQGFGYYFPTKQESFCTVNVREKGGAWQQLTLTNYPEKGSGNWTPFAENTISLSAFAGKTIEIGFKYMNDGKQSVAWEIKNVKVAESSGNTPDPGDKPVNPGTGSSVTFNFADPTTLNPAYSEADQTADGTTGNFLIDVNNVEFKMTPISITNSGTGTAARLYHQASGAWSYRFYNKSTLTVAASGGNKITSIEFATQTTTHKNNMSKVTPSSGSISETTWSGNASTVTFTVGATIGVTSIKVTYSN